MFPLLHRAFAFLLAFTLLGATLGRADEPAAPKDDALDRLLEKIEKPAPPPSAKPEAEPARGEAEKSKAEGEKPRGDGEKKPAGDVAPKDQALDNLLEKLGESRDAPAAPDERRGRPMPGDEGKDPGPGPCPAVTSAGFHQRETGTSTGTQKLHQAELEEMGPREGRTLSEVRR